MVRSNFWGVRQQNPAASFSRSSIAFLDGVQYAANAKRNKTIALPSTSDGAIPSAAGEGGEHIKVQCISGSYIFGIGVTSSRVYKSADGITWARTTSTQIVSASLFALSSGRLLGFASSTSADPTYGTKAWYSDNNWESVTEVIFGTARTASSVISTWNLWQNGSTILVCEYGASSALSGKYMYRSVDDGANFTKVADLTDQTPNPYHFHTVHYHAATGRWVAFFGDTMPLRGGMFSVDDGVNWTNLHTVGNYADQPIVCLDVGDPTRLMIGCDGSTTLGWVDVMNGEIEGVELPTDPRSTKNYCFALGQYAGVYYAGGFDNSGSNPAPAIWVSTDRAHWSVYHKFTVADAVAGCHHFVGYFGGKVHFLIQTAAAAYRTFSISPATVRNVSGVLIEPAVTNLANTENLSSFETNCPWTSKTSNWTVESSTTAPYIGSKCVRMYGIDEATATKNAASPDMALGDGAVDKYYIIQFRIKATRPIPVTTKLFRHFGTQAYVSTGSDSLFIADKNWKLCRSRPYVLSAGDAGNFQVYLSFQQGTVGAEVFLDSFQVTELPVSEWQIGGTAKTADVLTETVAATYEWTDVFAVQALDDPALYGSDFYIKTWKVGSDEIQLFWDHSESKFTIQRNAEAVSASAAQEWHPNQVVKFALRADAAGLTLDIQNGRAKEQITDSALAAVLNASVTMIYGDVSSANQFPGVYYDEADYSDDDVTRQRHQDLGFGFIPFKLSDAEVSAAFNLNPIAVPIP